MGIEASQWMQWMMWIKSRPDVTTTTIAKDHNLHRLRQGWETLTFVSGSWFGGGSSVMEVVDLRWLQKVNQQSTSPGRGATIATARLGIATKAMIRN